MVDIAVKPYYQPGPVPVEFNSEFLAGELWRISEAMRTTQEGAMPQFNVEEPNSLADGMVRYADGTNWNPGAGEGMYMYYNGQWNRVGGGGYTTISADTELVTAGGVYVDTSTAARAHTMPPLSTSSAGETVKLVGGADGVKKLSNNSADSSTPISVLFKKHDYVEVLCTGSAWLVIDERFTGVLEVQVDVDTAITNTVGGANMFVSPDYSVIEDTTGAFDSATNHRYEHPSDWPDCTVDLTYFIQAKNERRITAFPWLNGSHWIHDAQSIQAAEEQTYNSNTFKNLAIDAGQYLEFRARNFGAATDEIEGSTDTGHRHSYIVLKIERWTR